MKSCISRTCYYTRVFVFVTRVFLKIGNFTLVLIFVKRACIVLTNNVYFSNVFFKCFLNKLLTIITVHPL